MRVRDDPRRAAEVFCRQNGVTDAGTIDLLEETLRDLYFPSSWAPPPPTIAPKAPPTPSEASGSKSRPPPMAEEPEGVPVSTATSKHRTHDVSWASREGGVDGDHEGQVRGGAANRVADDASARALGALQGSANGVPDSQHPSSRSVGAPSSQESLGSAKTSKDATAGRQLQPEQHQQQQQQQQDQQSQHLLPNNYHQDTHQGQDQHFSNGRPSSTVAPAAESVVETTAPEPAAEYPSEVNVMETARRMQATAEASYDPRDPASVLVDLVVNGFPAPLLFRHPHAHPRGTRPDRRQHGHQKSDGKHGQDQAVKGGGEQEKDEFQREEEEEGVVTATARDWCRQFGSNRVEDIAFVEAEIRKALAAKVAAAAEAAAAPAAQAVQEAQAAQEAKASQVARATATVPAAQAAQAAQVLQAAQGGQESQSTPATQAESDGDAEREDASAGLRDHSLVAEQTAPQSERVSGAGGWPHGSRGAQQNHIATGGGRAGPRERAERPTVSSVLAPDLEEGTHIFSVKVDPRLPVVDVTAGSSALQISAKFCREHDLGPSQIPLVAWKLLEVYPAEIEVTRTAENLLSARMTLGYAACKREIWVVFLLLGTAALLWAARRRIRSWIGAGGSPPAASVGGGSVRRTKKTTASLGKRWPSSFRKILPSPRTAAVRWWRRPPRGRLGRGNYRACSAEPDRDRRPSSSESRGIGHSRGGGSEQGRGRKGGKKTSAAGGHRRSRGGSRNSEAAANAASTEGGSATGATGSSAAAGGNRGSSEGIDPGNGSTLASFSRFLESCSEAFAFECGRLLGTSVRFFMGTPAYIRRGQGNAAASVATAAAGAAEASSTFPPRSSRKGELRSSDSKRPGTATTSADTTKGSKKAAPGSEIVPISFRVASKESGTVSRGVPERDDPTTTERDDQQPLADSPAPVGNDKAPFSGGNIQLVSEEVDVGKGEGSVGAGVRAAGAAGAAVSFSGEQREPVTWATMLEGLATDPSNRFSRTAVLSNTGQVLARTKGFDIATHEACDWARLFKSKKGDIIVGGHMFVVLSREEGSIIIASKALGTKIIGSKTRCGVSVLGAYADLTKREAREGVAWLSNAVSSAPVR